MDPYPLSLLENSNSVRRSSVLQKLATPPFSCSRQTRSYRKNSVDLTTQMSPLRGECRAYSTRKRHSLEVRFCVFQNFENRLAIGFGKMGEVAASVLTR